MKARHQGWCPEVEGGLGRATQGRARSRPLPSAPHRRRHAMVAHHPGRRGRRTLGQGHLRGEGWMPLRGTCLRRCRSRSVSPLGRSGPHGRGSTCGHRRKDDEGHCVADQDECPQQQFHLFLLLRFMEPRTRNEGVGSTDRLKIRGRRGSMTRAASTSA
jgi:hypothetical protein